MLAFVAFLRRKDWPWILCGMVLTLGAALIPATTTILTGKVFTALSDFGAHTVSREEFLDRVLRYCIGLFVLSGASFLLKWSESTVWNLLGFNVGHRIRALLFKSYCQNDVAWMDNREKAVGRAGQSIKDVQQIESAIGVDTPAILYHITSALLCFGVAFYFSWKVTFICLLGFPLILILVAFLNPKISNKILLSKGIEDTISNRLHFIMSSLLTVKLFQKEEYEKCSISKLFKHDMQALKTVYHFVYAQEGTMRFLILAMYIQGFFFGSYQVREHNLPAGNVITVFWSCASGAMALQEAIALLYKLNEGSVSATRVATVTQSQDPATILRSSIGLFPTSPTSPPDITFKKVVFSYPSREGFVLAACDMHLKGGTIHYIVGPSGSGKSSIASLLMKQYPYQAGQISIDGNSLEVVSNHWIHDNITLVQQDAVLFDIPLIDNIKLGSKYPETITSSMVELALHEFDAEFVYTLPDGLYTSGSFPLSGGQKQRIQLVKAYLSDTPIIIFDEPTSGLDRDTEDRVMKSIRRLCERKTAIIITHNLYNIPEGASLHCIDNGIATSISASDSFVDMKDDFSDLSQKEQIREEIRSISSSTSLESKTSDAIDSPAPLPRTFNTALLLLKQFPQKPLLLLGFVCVILQAVANPVFAFLFSRLLMGIMPGSDTNITLWAMLVLMGAFVDGALTYSTVLVPLVCESWGFSARNQIVSNLLHHDSFSSEDTTYNRKLLLSDLESCKSVVSEYWKSWVNMLVLGSVGLIWALASGWKLSMVGLSLIPMVIVLAVFDKHTTLIWNKRRETERLFVTKMLDDIVTQFRTIKVQNLEKYFSLYFMEREQILWRVSLRLSIFTGFSGGLIPIFTPLAEGIILYYGMKLIATGEYSVQKLMQVFSLLIFSLVSLDALSSSIQSVGNGFEALPRVFDAYYDIWGCKAEHGLKSEGTEWGEISFQNLTIDYTGVRNLSHNIQPHKITAIIGPSGIGKSTLARVLLRFAEPTSGAVFIGGENLLDIPTECVRRHVTMVSQMPLDFFEGTILENLCYGLDLNCNIESYVTIVAAMCDRCGIHEYISQLPDGYNTNMKNGLLSGGQLQRLGIARALLREPSVLILDEVTSALDQANREKILQLIKECVATQKITVILITHQQQVRDIADLVIDLS